MKNYDKNNILKKLPSIDHILKTTSNDEWFLTIPRSIVLSSARTILESIRKDILDEKEKNIKVLDENIILKIKNLAKEKMKPKLVKVINATGVVLHTNIGRAVLCEDALKSIQEVAGSYSNLELNLKTGKRGSRYEVVDDLICELTGAQSSVVVNNNAAAVLLALNTIAKNKKVIVSRGELIEIGGSFRIPEIMEKSICILKEVGTTNRTHLADYENAICENTSLLLKIHTSNYTIKGFTTNVSLNDLTKLGQEKNITVMEDLGSGTLIDFSKYNLGFEPKVSDSIKTGADIVTFSGDKLLGGPQAGIIAGNKQSIDKIKKNPLLRALRIDKMTLTALEVTLKLYYDEQKAIEKIPTLKMLTMPLEDISKKAKKLLKLIDEKAGSRAKSKLMDMSSKSGGGSLPEICLPSKCVSVKPLNISISKFERSMRLSTPSVIGRIENDQYILDPRTIFDGQEQIISSTIDRVLEQK